MAIILAPRKKLRLMSTLQNPHARVLKTCTRCRQHKTRCDAVTTHPGPCSHCSKKKLKCTLEVISKKPDRGNDMVERLGDEVSHIKYALEAMTDRKNKLIQALAQRKKQGPSIAEIQHVLELETPEASILPPLGPSYDSDFILSSEASCDPFTISIIDAQYHFADYQQHFLKHLPIFPPMFFNEDVMSIYNSNDLLFWCIILTSYRRSSNYSKFLHLSKHIKARVVEMCWYNTPRHVYTLASLLILTTWPLPAPHDELIENNIAVKFIALMKRIALQLGLHKVEFINEFSHKTEVNISEESHLNNLIRERIYKFIAINSNYWLINLGISNSNYNGTETDYVINKANALFEGNLPEDRYTNWLLRLSLIQLKLNETILEKSKASYNDSTKLMNIHMFDVIVNRLTLHHDLKEDSLSRLSVEFSRLQLYIYGFSIKNVTLKNYKNFLKRALVSCKRALDLYEESFGEVKNFAQVPIHYGFILELVSLILMRIFHSPYLDTTEEYETVKNHFLRAYCFLSKVNDDPWRDFNSKHLSILKLYDNACLESGNKVSLAGNSVFLVEKLSNYMVSSLKYEMIFSIYENKRHETSLVITWSQYGLDERNASNGEVIEYLLHNCTIFKT